MGVVQLNTRLPLTPGHKRSPRKPSRRINTRQARSIMEGLAFARQTGTPLNAHLTIHWGGTGAARGRETIRTGRGSQGCATFSTSGLNGKTYRTA